MTGQSSSRWSDTPRQPDGKHIIKDYAGYRIPKPGNALRDLATKDGEIPTGFGMIRDEVIGKWIGLAVAVVFWTTIALCIGFWR